VGAKAVGNRQNGNKQSVNQAMNQHWPSCSCTTHKLTHASTRNPTCNKARTGNTVHAVSCTVVGGNLSQRQSQLQLSGSTHVPTNKQSRQPAAAPTPLEQATHRRPGLLRGEAASTIHTHTHKTHTKHTHNTQQAVQASGSRQHEGQASQLCCHTHTYTHSPLSSATYMQDAALARPDEDTLLQR
jgi:hypothetical protein